MNNVYEEKNIAKAVLKLGLPAMAGSLTTLIYNLADTYFVALTKDPAMIAGVTLCAPVLLIIMSVACIFGMGGSSVIARLIGENEDQRAAECFNFCAYAMVIAGVAVTLLGLLLTGPIADGIGADADNRAYTCDYLRWIFIGAPAIILANGLVHTFRSVGLVKEASIGLALGNGINIVFDWLLIVVLRMGTAGAAAATSFGFFCACIYYLIVLAGQEKKHNAYIKMAPKYFTAKKAMVKNVFRIGIPGALITVMLSAANILLNNFIAVYGSDAVASYGIAYKIDMFPVMLSVGLSQGAGPLVGYCYGQRNEKTLSQSMTYSVVYGVVFGAVLTFVLFFGSRALADVFLDDEALIAQTSHFLRLICFHAPLQGVINMVTAYFQALGRALSSLAITVLRNLILFVPCLLVMNALFGLDGVILNQLVTEILITVICVIMYVCSSPRKALAAGEPLPEA